MGDRVTVLFGGDCHFGDKPLRLDAGLRERIGQAAFVVVNQESPITEAESPAVDKPIPLKSSVLSVNWLRDLGVKVVSLANNHIADYGREGLAETRSRLTSAGITPVGAGADISEAGKPAYIDFPDGPSVAFLAFTSRSIGSKIVGESDHGCSELERAAVERAIEAARERASHVVLQLHYGMTNFNYPAPEEREMLRSFAGRGADLIIGHHPHVLQGYEIVDGTPIFYSLGNLIFASYRKRGKPVPLSTENRNGALVAVALSPEGARVEDVIFTETTESQDHLLLAMSPFPSARARSFEQRSRNLARASYRAFFKRYALQRLLYRLLLWTSPRRWSTFSGAQVNSLWLSVLYAVGLKK